jgi:hypothetical protein
MEDPFDASPVPDFDTSIRTRCGYPIIEVIKAFKSVLEQGGAAAAGKSLHYSADLICSGCIELWKKFLFEFAFDHIGVASPRIFVFLDRRFQELDILYARLTSEAFYSAFEAQKKIAECVLIVRSCPRKPPLKMPRVPPETHSNEWVRQSIGPLEITMPTPLARTYRSGNDLIIVRRIGHEFIKACEQGATEKAFFWIKWLFEEESFLKKETRGSLSSLERGPSEWPSKSRNHIGFFFCDLLLEIYKEYQAKGLIRMNEEFIGILDLYRKVTKLSGKRRLDCLCLCIQLLCEVPKWKVPAAPSLVSDPVQLERASGHAEQFFREVLVYAPIGSGSDIVKEAKKAMKPSQEKKKMTTKEKNAQKLEDNFAACDAVLQKMMFS